MSKSAAGPSVGVALSRSALASVAIPLALIALAQTLAVSRRVGRRPVQVPLKRLGNVAHVAHPTTARSGAVKLRDRVVCRRRRRRRRRLSDVPPVRRYRRKTFQWYRDWTTADASGHCKWVCSKCYQRQRKRNRREAKRDDAAPADGPAALLEVQQ